MGSTTPKVPSQEQLDYIARNWIIDPIEGVVTSRKTGKPMGTLHADGHLVSNVLNRQLYLHHAIWWKHYGRWPVMQIDHRDRDGVNNRIGNLFEVTHSVQMLNREVPTTRAHTGVQDDGKYGFSVRSSIEGKTTYLGTYPTIEEANRVYQEQKQQRLQKV